MEVSSLTVLPVTRIQTSLRRRPRIFPSGERRARSSALSRPLVFETRPAALTGSLSRAEDGTHDVQRLATPIRFPSAAGTLTGSSSTSGGRRKRSPRCYPRTA